MRLLAQTTACVSRGHPHYIASELPGTKSSRLGWSTLSRILPSSMMAVSCAVHGACHGSKSCNMSWHVMTLRMTVRCSRKLNVFEVQPHGWGQIPVKGDSAVRFQAGLTNVSPNQTDGRPGQPGQRGTWGSGGARVSTLPGLVCSLRTRLKAKKTRVRETSRLLVAYSLTELYHPATEGNEQVGRDCLSSSSTCEE